MAVQQSEYSAGTKVFTWDKNAVSGEVVEIWADNPDDDTPIAFKKKAINDGEGTLAFPEGHTGTCLVEVRGENDTVETGTLTI